MTGVVLKLLLFLIVTVILFIAFHNIMKRIFKAKEIRLFKTTIHHVNETHKKIDWTIRFTFLALLLLSYVMEWMLLHMVFVCAMVTDTVRAIMEFKHAENPNVYKLTISHLIFFIVFYAAFLFTIFKTNYLGL